jgi:Ca2+-binding RTX toxin-like protein
MPVRAKLAAAALPATLVTVLVASSAASGAPACGGKSATIVGTPGDDSLTGTQGADVIVGLSGDDLINGLGGNDRICGDDGSDFLEGGAGADFTDAGPGSNITEGGPGPDHLHGGPDNDGVSYGESGAGVTVDLAAGRATGGEGPDTLTGLDNVFDSSHHDVVLGDGKTNLFFVSGGADRIDGRGGTDHIGYQLTSGVSANLTGGTAVHVDRNGVHTDTLVHIEEVTGSDQTDTLIGDPKSNGLFGEGGDDIISGRGGDDQMVGGPGRNRISGGPGTLDIVDFSLSASGPVSVNLATRQAKRGNEESDALQSVEAVDGSPYADRLIGNDADNLFAANGGDDRIDGRAGRDTVAYAFTVLPGPEIVPAAGPARVDLTAGTAHDAADPTEVSGDRLTRVEDVISSPHNDVLLGNDHPNLFISDAGDDVLRGREGNDAFNPGPGADQIHGGPGDGDSALYFSEARITADLAQGTVEASSGTDRLAGAEIVSGTPGRDVMLGGPADDILIGGLARDRLAGRAGDDVLIGGGLNAPDHLANQLDGGPGHDSCQQGRARRCESRALPPDIRANLREARIQERRAPRLRKGGHRRNF